MEKVREIDPRRAELGDFLRRRRSALTPESAGLPAGVRRRTPGLRREEVAELAEISVALYTWLEQGRDVPVSRRTIDAVATALRLSPGEHRHLHYLALQEEVTLREEISPSLRRMVSTLRYPVFVLDHNWDIVLSNPASDLVFRSHVEGDAPTNLLESVFLVDYVRDLFPDYEQVVASLLAMFRLEFPAHADDPRSIELVERLRAESPLFNELWERYDVKEHPSGVRVIDHPEAGSLSFEPALLGVVESPGLRMMLYTPADETTAEVVEKLVAEHTADANASLDRSGGAMSASRTAASGRR